MILWSELYRLMNCSGRLAQASVLGVPGKYLQLSWCFSGGVSSVLIWVWPWVICQRLLSAVVWGQYLSWLSSVFPLGMVVFLVASVLVAHLELDQVVRLSCVLPEALSLLMKHFWMRVPTNEVICFLEELTV